MLYCMCIMVILGLSKSSPLWQLVVVTCIATLPVPAIPQKLAPIAIQLLRLTENSVLHGVHKVLESLHIQWCCGHAWGRSCLLLHSAVPGR